jgi:malonate transporter
MQAIFNVALPIFGVILAGLLAGRWRILGGEATAALNAFVSYFALPVLFFGTLARTPVRTVLDPHLMLGFGVVVLATFAVGMLSTWLAVRGGLARMSLQGIASSWGNVGYMGVPLCLAAFGEPGLPPAMLAVIVTSVISMVFGVMLIELEVAAGHGPVLTFFTAACRSPPASPGPAWRYPCRHRSRNGSISWARRPRPVPFLRSDSSSRTNRCVGASPRPAWRP